MKKIYYSTYYDTTNKICGYVLATEKEDCYLINENQYKNALKNAPSEEMLELNFIHFFRMCRKNP